MILIDPIMCVCLSITRQNVSQCQKTALRIYFWLDVCILTALKILIIMIEMMIQQSIRWSISMLHILNFAYYHTPHFII